MEYHKAEISWRRHSGKSGKFPASGIWRKWLAYCVIYYIFVVLFRFLLYRNIAGQYLAYCTKDNLFISVWNLENLLSSGGEPELKLYPDHEVKYELFKA